MKKSIGLVAMAALLSMVGCDGKSADTKSDIHEGYGILEKTPQTGHRLLYATPHEGEQESQGIAVIKKVPSHIKPGEGILKSANPSTIEDQKPSQ